MTLEEFSSTIKNLDLPSDFIYMELYDQPEKIQLEDFDQDNDIINYVPKGSDDEFQTKISNIKRIITL